MEDINNFLCSKDSLDFTYTHGASNIYNTMQFHFYYEIYYFLEGEVEFITNHTRKKLIPNQLVIIPPGTYHYFRILDDAANYKRCVLNIFPEFINKAILEEAFKGKEILNLSMSDRIAKHFKYLIECMSKVSEEDFKFILASSAIDILYLIKYSNKNEENHYSNFSTLAKSLIEFIDSNYTKQITLCSLAKKFNYSVSHISHVFKEEFGISIKQYILQLRINSACAQIKQGGRAQEVCVQNGFIDYTAFYRLYKKTYGIAPSKSKK